jgi:FPC/CPF motif-containing protein YcgG
MIAEYIEQTVATHSNPEIRIETMTHYRQNKEALADFIEELMQEQMDRQIFESLGLRWHHPEHHYANYKNSVKQSTARLHHLA